MKHDATFRVLPARAFGERLAGLPACRGIAQESLAKEDLLRIPRPRGSYLFEPRVYQDLASWWNWAGAEPLLITGPAGAGKTSAVLEFCARLSQPVVIFTARPRMDRRELIGRWVLGEKGMTWVDGPASLAWRHGWLLLVNEFSAAPPEAWVSANDLLEGLPIENDQTGEVIARHRAARIVFTDNCRGHASESLTGYFGRSQQDRSVIDRLWHMRIEGLGAEAEAQVLLAELDSGLADRAGASAAGEIAAFLGRACAETRGSAAADAIGFSRASFALSHRTARRMAELMLRTVVGDVPAGDDPLARITDVAVGSALDRPVRDALVTYLKTVFGTRLEELAAECAAAAGVSGLSASIGFGL